MTLQELQERVDSWIAEYGVRYFDILTNIAILAEETGEVARVVARGWGEQSFKKSEFDPADSALSELDFAKERLGEELADLLWVVVAIANQTGINLSQVMEENFAKKSERDATRHKSNKKLV